MQITYFKAKKVTYNTTLFYKITKVTLKQVRSLFNYWYFPFILPHLLLQVKHIHAFLKVISETFNPLLEEGS